VVAEGYKSKEGEDMNPNVNQVGPGFFSTAGTPLIAGREFNERDVLGAQKVAILNETAAKYFFPTQNPLGRHIGFGRPKQLEIEIVGIVKDDRSVSLREKTPRYVYVPYMQDDQLSQITFYVRTSQDTKQMGNLLRRQVQNIDANLPVFEMKSMEVQVNQFLFTDRLIASLSAFFGLLATLLAAIGLYGVMAYMVARRTREIGIRVALGAERRNVLWIVMKEVTLLSLIGVAIGLPSAFGLGRLVESQLYGIAAHDAFTMSAATLLLCGVSFLAGYLPAERASRVDPLVALRYE
jgi:predicted permease